MGRCLGSMSGVDIRGRYPGRSRVPVGVYLRFSVGVKLPTHASTLLDRSLIGTKPCPALHPSNVAPPRVTCGRMRARARASFRFQGASAKVDRDMPCGALFARGAARPPPRLDSRGWGRNSAARATPPRRARGRRWEPRASGRQPRRPASRTTPPPIDCGRPAPQPIRSGGPAMARWGWRHLGLRDQLSDVCASAGQVWPGFGRIWCDVDSVSPGVGQIWLDSDRIGVDVGQTRSD